MKTNTKWIPEKIEQSIIDFREKNGRFPYTHEMDNESYLPTRKTFLRIMEITYSDWRKEHDPTHNFVDKKFLLMDNHALVQWLRQRSDELNTKSAKTYNALRGRHEPSMTFIRKRISWSDVFPK